MQNFTTAAQVELGDAFGLSPASCEWLAESLMTGPVANVPSESAITDRIIREICYLESRQAAAEAAEALLPAGVEVTPEFLAAAQRDIAAARDAQYAATGREVEALAKELGLL